jgi:hypothetical protein
VLILAAATTLTPGVSLADNLKGFWGRGAATNWKKTPQGNSSAQLQYRDYPLSIDQVKQLRAEEQAIEEKVQQQLTEKAQEQGGEQLAKLSDASSDTPEQAGPSKTLSREEIIARYGAPEEDRPIQAQKDAPAEMKALIEALNSGDKELAWRYALALARRDTATMNVVSKVTDIRLLAAEALGMRPEQEFDPEKQVDPTRLEFREFFEQARRAELQRKLDVEKAIKAAEQGQLEDSWQVKPDSTGKEQIQPGEIPVDPAGKVRLLVFFDEKDPKIKELSTSLRHISTAFKADRDVSLLGLTRGSYATPGLKKVAATTSFPFPILNGEALALDLRIHRYPTFVFVAPTTKERYRLDGLRTPGDIEKVIRLMKGGR